ncbi:MAG TPA: sigma-70 family RNA polymerase sigma factor [Candidatus Paceibacterota bacterium]
MLDGENKLIRDAIRGESSAFGLLYGHYQPQIYRFIFLKVGRREEAEDVTHQVFLSAWTNVASYKDRGHPFSSWLYQIARNKVIDFYRTQKADLPLESAEEVFISSAESHLEDFETKATIEEVQQAILKLKPEYQEVIILRFVEDLSLKEAALALGKSEGAVKLLQHRAVKNLKQHLT